MKIFTCMEAHRDTDDHYPSVQVDARLGSTTAHAASAVKVVCRSDTSEDNPSTCR